MTVYRISKWREVFERAESRKLKVLHWVSVPISFQSNGYQSLLDEFGDDAASIYGAWCALVALAASCTVRGLLANGRGNPLPISHVSRITGLSSSVFERLYRWASKPDVGWLEPVAPEEVAALLAKTQENADFSGPSGDNGKSSGDSPTYRTGQDQTGQDITKQDSDGQDKTPEEDSSPSLFEVDCQSVVESATRLVKASIGLKDDRDWLWSLCWVAHQVEPEMIDGWEESLRKRGDDRVRNARKYLDRAVAKACEERGHDWHRLKRSVPPVPKREVVASADGDAP